MKPLMALVLAAAALAAPVCSAAERGAGSALVGTWAVDTTRLPMPVTARPRSVTLSFTSDGPDRLRIRVEVVDPTGASREADGAAPLDGSPTPVKANFEADVMAMSMPTPEVLVMQLAKNGSPASTRIYAVGPHGDAMIETVAHFDAAGRPVLRQNHFRRVR